MKKKVFLALWCGMLGLDRAWNSAFRAVCLLFVLFLSACGSRSRVLLEDQSVVARVHNQRLYQNEVETAYHTIGFNQDSIDFVNEYVKEWTSRQLILFYGPQYIEWNEGVIEDKIQNYRYALLMNALHAQYVAEQIDVPISEDEIRKYYDAKPENFILSHDILRLVSISLPLESAQMRRARACVRSKETTSWDVLLADSTLVCHWDDSRWYSVQEVLEWFPRPYSQARMRAQLSRPHYFELKGNKSIHLVHVLACRRTQDKAPILYVEDEIKRIILSKRRDAAIQALKEKIWNEAKRDNAVDIYL